MTNTPQRAVKSELYSVVDRSVSDPETVTSNVMEVLREFANPADLCRAYERATGRMPTDAELNVMLITRDAILGLPIEGEK